LQHEDSWIQTGIFPLIQGSCQWIVYYQSPPGASSCLQPYPPVFYFTGRRNNKPTFWPEVFTLI